MEQQRYGSREWKSYERRERRDIGVENGRVDIWEDKEEERYERIRNGGKDDEVKEAKGE